jgi:hypothetical protein
MKVRTLSLEAQVKPEKDMAKGRGQGRHGPEEENGVTGA